MEIRCYKKNIGDKTRPHVIDKYNDKNEHFQSLLEKVFIIEKDYLDKVNKKLLSQVEPFSNDSFSRWKDNPDKTECIVDVGILQLGINISDHTNTMSYLTETLAHSSHRKVIKISSDTCKTMKRVLETICNSIVYSDDSIKLQLAPSLKYSVCALKTWAYGNKNVKKEQIIVILEDVESLNAQLLQNIIEIISTLLPVYPFLLLMSVSSSTDTLNEMLTIRSLSRLSMQLFHLPSPVTLLNDFFLKITKAVLPFQLSYRVFAYLVDHMFLRLDYSMENLIARYKYCLLEHAMHSDVISESIASDEDIRCHMSHVTLSYKLIHWLLDLFSDLKDTSLGNQFYQLLGIQLETSIGKSRQFKATLDLFRSLTDDEIAASIRRANQSLVLNNETNPICIELMKMSEKFAEEILNKNIEDKFQKPVTVISNSVKRKPSIREIQKDLLKSIQENKSVKEMKPIDSFVSSMQKWFSENLPHYSTLIGYKKVYFDDLEHLEENVNPRIKSTIELGLTNPYYYVKNDKLRIEDLSSVNEWMPDICIIFKLLQECPRVVNLYDLLQAFATIISEDVSKNPPSLKIQCRFMQSIAELQFLGIIKGTNMSKADQVTKLTWPGLF